MSGVSLHADVLKIVGDGNGIWPVTTFKKSLPGLGLTSSNPWRNGHFQQIHQLITKHYL